MIPYIFRRLLLIIPTTLLITVIVFSILHLVPGNPAEVYLGDQHSSEELLETIREKMGLDRPLHVQYLSYLWNLLHGDMGDSLFTNKPVSHAIMKRAPHTLILTSSAIFIALFVGISFGSLAAIYHNTWIDNFAMIGALVGISMPIFWSGLLLILVFSVWLGWFPCIGTGGFRSLVLPATALGFLSASLIARLVRSSMLEVLNQDYIRTARSKGLQEWLVLLRHALRNALIPIITMAGIQFGRLLGGAVLTETVFARLGVGTLYVEAILNKDYPVVQGVTLFVAVSFMLVNLIIDICYASIDPRIKYD